MINKYCLFLLITMLVSYTLSGQQNPLDRESRYKSALDYLINQLKTEKQIENTRSGIKIGGTYIQIRLDDFADKFNTQGKNYLSKIIDSLKKISTYLNEQCSSAKAPVIPISRKDKSPKYIVFFSNLCDYKLQADLFLYDDKLTEDQYLGDYYGSFQTYLFEFDNKYHINRSFNTTVFNH